MNAAVLRATSGTGVVPTVKSHSDVGTDLIERLLADPSQLQDVPAREIPRIHNEVACVQMRLVALQSALLRRVQNEPDHCPTANVGERDRMLTVDEAAVVLGVQRRWVQNRYADLPFVRRLGRRTIRISESALLQWMERRCRR